jgi:hypothetical protein
VDAAEELPEALDRAVVDEGSMLSLEIGLCLGQEGRVREAMGSGVELVTWTVNQAREASGALAMGIRRITTDEVEDLLAWKEELSRGPA